MAMTEEERKEARRLAAKKWYETHKKAKHAAKPVRKSEKPVKSAKPARKSEKPVKPGKTVRKADSSDKAKAAIEKRAAKLAIKGVKAVAAMKAVIKDAASIITDAHKTADEKLIDSVMSKLMRTLSLGISPVENGKGVLSSTLQAAYRVPKSKTAPRPEPGPDVSEPESEPELAEVPVGDATDVEVASNEGFDSDSGYDIEDEDNDADDPDADNDDEDEDADDDEDDEYFRGREDMFREFGEMGVGEEDS